MEQTEVQYGGIDEPFPDYTHFIFDQGRGLFMYDGLHTGLLPQKHWGSGKAESLSAYFKEREDYLRRRGTIIPVKIGTASVMLLDSLVQLADIVGTDTAPKRIDRRIVEVYCETFNDIWKQFSPTSPGDI
jgi:hypothetical protein